MTLDDRSGKLDERAAANTLAVMPSHVRRKAPRSPAITIKHVRMLADAMLAELELEHAELSVLLTNDATIRTLNREHRKKDRPTDVLSFAAIEPRRFAAGSTTAPRLLGDIVISLDTAARQARSRKRALIAEVRWLLAHGVLHLIGYDHATLHDKKQMVAFTQRLVRAAELPAAWAASLGDAESVRLVKTPRKIHLGRKPARLSR